jgi:hypothetical protein
LIHRLKRLPIRLRYKLNKLLKLRSMPVDELIRAPTMPTKANKKALGKAQARIARGEQGFTGTGFLMSKKSKRKAQLQMGKAAARNLVQGTIDANRAKREAQSTDSNN